MAILILDPDVPQPDALFRFRVALLVAIACDAKSARVDDTDAMIVTRIDGRTEDYWITSETRPLIQKMAGIRDTDLVGELRIQFRASEFVLPVRHQFGEGSSESLSFQIDISPDERMNAFDLATHWLGQVADLEDIDTTLPIALRKKSKRRSPRNALLVAVLLGIAALVIALLIW